VTRAGRSGLGVWQGLVLALAVAVAASDASAQVRDSTTRRDSTARRDTVPGRRDSVVTDTAAARRDSLRNRPLVEWATPDSATDALQRREGYTVTRYQGTRVLFHAAQRVIDLKGKAAVQRDETILVGDSVEFNDSTKVVKALGDTLTLRDPSQGDDVIAHGRIEYNITSQEGKATEVNTSVLSGERWLLYGHNTGFVNDTSAAGHSAFYAREGWLTSCQDSAPHYHFASKEMKVIAKDVLVARPAILYIGDIPVMWLPFVFQDLRSGRRSGLIPPRFGASEIVRNSPFYRRTIENFGYYFNLNDYMDAQVTLDWRSSARATVADPGWVRINGLWRYKWLNRFMDGQIAVSRHSLSNGSTNQAYTWNHSQDFSLNSHLHANVNYVTNTVVQQNTAIQPYPANIVSGLNYTQTMGPLNLAIGGTQTQYSGRRQVNRQFPQLSLTSKPLGLGDWLTWIPGLTLSVQQSLHVDQTGGNALVFTRLPDGLLRTDTLEQNTRTTTMGFQTPLKIFGFDLGNTFNVVDNLQDFAQPVTVVDVADSSKKTRRTYARTFSTTVDWSPSFSLPPFLSGSWKLTPSVSLVNVDAHPFLVRTHLTDGEFVSQSKRLQYSVSAAPTLFGLFPGFGPVSRFRHSINPTISWQYAPAATVSDAYLHAFNQTRQGYLGSLMQNQVSLGLSSNIEAKLRPKSDSAPDENAQRIKVLSANFSSLSWDFSRAAHTGRTGLTSTNFSIALASDLLPGFSYDMGYSLFDGNPASDSARFKPFLENIHTSLSLNKSSPILAAFARLFGINPKPTKPASADSSANAGPTYTPGIAGSPISGTYNRATQQSLPTGQGFTANLSFSTQKSRPIRGDSVVTNTPEIACRPFLADPFAHDRCLQQQALAPGSENPFGSTVPGGIVYHSPPVTSIQSTMGFDITPKWSTQWQTTYDVEKHAFASHSVRLQRALHDWNAIFSFVQGSNGNFAFTFFIALKAEPDLKFNYDRRDYRRPPGTTSSSQ
jgi:hypothetical protein